MAIHDWKPKEPVGTSGRLTSASGYVGSDLEMSPTSAQSSGYVFRDELFERDHTAGKLADHDEYVSASEDIIDRLQSVADDFDGFVAALADDAASVVEALRDVIGDLSARIDWVLQSSFNVPSGSEFVFPDGMHWRVREIDE